MTHSILHMDPTTLGVNAATVTAQPFIWSMGQTMLAALASLFTIVWMGIQITMAIQDYLDKKHRREEQASNPNPGNQTVTVVQTPNIVVTQQPDGTTEVH